jgi:hypothetical protein
MNLAPSNTTSAKCTKCDISFPDVRSLGDHFAQSPAHPYCAPAPINSWSAPEKPAVPLEGRHTFPHPLEKSPPVREQNNANTTEKTVKCECGKGFKTSSALTQHRKYAWKHNVSLEGRVAPVKQHGDEALLGSSKSQTGAGDEADGLCSILEKLVIV